MNNQDNISKAHKVASNTIILFLRMFVITIINLYTVRIVLKGLGVVDYGIYNAVAGVVTTTSFICSILELSIQRFYSVSLGKNDFTTLRKIYSISLKATGILTIIILIVFETIGLWFIENKLNIPMDRNQATLFCFHFSLVAFLFSLLQIPFSAAIFSHEDMNVYAVISSCDCFLKLIAAIMLGYLAIDNLIFYSFSLLFIAFVTFLNYSIYGKIKYKECSYIKTKDKCLTKSILSFSGWTMFGSIAKVCMIQGNTIILNIFFGPITNAAFAISLQISNAFNALCNSMILAVRPTMIKAYANNSKEYLYNIFNICNKFLLYVLISVSLPMIYNIDTIMSIWLQKVTSETILFAQLTIIYIVILAMNSPITTIMQASGHIKTYFVSVESVSLLCVPLGYVAFILNYPSHAIFYSMISLCIIAHIVRLVCLKREFDLFKYKDYILGLCVPAIFITIIGIGAEKIISDIISNPLLHLVTSCLLLPVTIIFFSYAIGLRKKEKKILIELSRTYIHKH